ncbi:MAG TPA: methyltransferase domain-containing protein [Candidatus Saccharimonadia bacterium]|nr:methyltransferase domain-containing protein [Candidatus Saccharimonadia bacterium]
MASLRTQLKHFAVNSISLFDRLFPLSSRTRVRLQYLLWRLSHKSESGYWNRVITAAPGTGYARLVAERMDPCSPLRDDVAALVDRVPSDAVSLLDVGAGPFTDLGKIHPRKTLTITAVDPLADSYIGFLEARGITPPVVTTFCKGEQLSRQYPENGFDISYANNSLDHSYDPLEIIIEMVRVTKVGGWCFMRHWENEAEFENYTGMHFWNFSSLDGDFMLSSKSVHINITKTLAPVARTSVEVKTGTGRASVVTTIEKTSATVGKLQIVTQTRTL